MHEEKRSQSSDQSPAYLPIEDYALIGDLHTVALVGKNGSIDWCCLPRFDSPSFFGALLDTRKGGFFRIAPTDEDQNITYKQLYLPETNVLLSRFLTGDGIGEITDFMPIKKVGSAEHQHQIIRSVEVVHGSLSFTLVCRPGFNFARDSHSVEISRDGAIFQSQSFGFGLASPLPLQADGQGGVHATFTLHAGQSAHFVLESARRSEQAPQPLTDDQYQSLFQASMNFWRNWLSQCNYQGRWREMVQRSALVLKLLTYAPTGAIVAAPTTSLPEAIGGDRNWDYRYTWLRDASFSLFSLLTLGFTHEAEAFMRWLDARCHELKGDGTLQPMYGIDGEHDLAEITLDHLASIYIYNRYDAVSYDLWQNVIRLLKWLESNWQEPDEGIWEVRGGPKPLLHSRLMSWVAFDRALRVARQRGWPAPEAAWGNTRSEMYQQIMTQGWDPQTQSFVQHYGSHAIDASALLLMITHFTGSKEPRMLSTISRIQQELASGALVRRYNPASAANDGLDSHEATFKCL